VADRQMGAAHSLRPGGGVEAWRYHDPNIGEHLRARADRAGPGRARARGARLLPSARSRPVPGGQRGLRSADPERARAALKDVKRLGVSIALDKFGSGQYSLGLPSDLPLDIVKLDRGLIESFDRDKERRAMFAATIALAARPGSPRWPSASRRTVSWRSRANCTASSDRASCCTDRPPRTSPPQGAGLVCNVRAMASSRATGGSDAVSDSESIARHKQAAATAAAELIEDGMRVGLGTGSTVAFLLPAIAARECKSCCAWRPRPHRTGRRSRSAERAVAR